MPLDIVSSARSRLPSMLLQRLPERLGFEADCRALRLLFGFSGPTREKMFVNPTVGHAGRLLWVQCVVEGRRKRDCLRFPCYPIVSESQSVPPAVPHEFSFAHFLSWPPLISSEAHCDPAFTNRESRHWILESSGGCRRPIVTSRSARTFLSFQSAKDQGRFAASLRRSLPLPKY